MTDAETRRLETFMRVRQYLSAREKSFPAGSRGKELSDEIDSAIADLEKHSTAQDSHRLGARHGTSALGGARESLRDDLEAVHATVRGIARSVPGLEEKFRLPGRRDQELLTRARAFAQEAEPLKQEFVRRGMQADFLERLAADTDAFEQLIDDRGKDEGARVAATAAIDAAIERGMEAVRELDAVVRNTFRDDRAALAEWTSASHVERAARTRQTDAGGKKDSAPAPNDPHGAPTAA